MKSFSSRIISLLAVGSVLAISGCSVSNESMPETAPADSTDSSFQASEKRIFQWADSSDSTDLKWNDCNLDSSELEVPEEVEFQCAELTVPVNWFYDEEVESEETTEISVLRASSGSPYGKRDLMLNPGGPGVSGTDTALHLALTPDTEALRKDFNLVGFDPRGVPGIIPAADPLSCEGSPTPDCVESTVLTHHASTSAVAHDMEYLRVRLGEKPLNYMGFSYGTYLGSIYATLFPNSVGRMFLDGPADDELLLPDDSGDEQEEAVKMIRERFLEACVSGDIGECPFEGSVRDAEDQISDKSNHFDENPVELEDGLEVNKESIDEYIVEALYGGRSTWPSIADTLSGVMDEDPEALQKIAGSDATVSTAYEDAIVCSNPIAQSMEGCVEQDILDPKVKYMGKSTIVVVAKTGDPATPYSAAHRFKDKLGNAVLVTVDGEGHIASFSGEAPCADKIRDDYLIEGIVPEDGTRCTTEFASNQPVR